MLKKENKTTKEDILKKIEIMLKKDINLDAQQVFARVEGFLEPKDKIRDFTAEGIGYVQIDEKRQAEYLAWEKGIKQEWFAIIENLRESIRKRTE